MKLEAELLVTQAGERGRGRDGNEDASDDTNYKKVYLSSFLQVLELSNSLKIIPCDKNNHFNVSLS